MANNLHPESYGTPYDEPTKIARIAGSAIPVRSQANPNPDKEIAEAVAITDENGTPIEGQEEEYQKDVQVREGLRRTHPNLHRRIKRPTTLNPDTHMVDKDYRLHISGTDSYRTVNISYHCEDEILPDGSLNEDEIP